MNVRKLFPGILLILLGALPLHAQKSLTATEARAHIGETASVCGVVASTHYSNRTKGEPTFLNLDEPYPHRKRRTRAVLTSHG
jgi:hypothetical protein